MMVRNEELALPRCLESVRSLATEIIIVDTGSTDGTRRVAVEYRARVLPFDFSTVDFSAARNYGLAQATNRWILVLDADEVLDPQSIPIIQELIGSDRERGYFLERQNHWSAPKPPTRDYAVRLFPNHPAHRYQGRVHETIDASILSAGGRLEQTDIRIDHNLCADPEIRRRQSLAYIEILKQEIASGSVDGGRLDFLAAEYHQLEMFAEATKIAEQIAELRPFDAKAHLFAGVYHLLYQPDLAKARADLTRALELRPGYPEAKAFLDEVNRGEAGANSLGENGSRAPALWPKVGLHKVKTPENKIR
jgi:tetratricopeptide (TPR) repeat protein